MVAMIYQTAAEVVKEEYEFVVSSSNREKEAKIIALLEVAHLPDLSWNLLSLLAYKVS